MPRVRVISDSILRCLCRHILSYHWGAVFPRTRWNQALSPPHLVEVEVEIHRVTVFVWFFTLTIFYPRGSFPLIHWFPSIPQAMQLCTGPGSRIWCCAQGKWSLCRSRRSNCESWYLGCDEDGEYVPAIVCFGEWSAMDL